jgi:hypothetical protein
MNRPTRAVLDERLMCHVVSLAYDFRNHTGQLYVGDGECCDMSGCVALFEGIDPEVKAVNTFAGDQADTAYRKKGNDWSVIPPSVP